MPDTPTWTEALRSVIGTELDEVHTMLPGRVHAFSRNVQTADIEPLVLLPGGTEMPVVNTVPVLYPGVYWDLDEGDAGILVVADHDWRGWFRTGDVTPPETDGQHALHNAVFLPGLNKRADARTLPDGAKVVDADDLRLGDPAATEAVLLGTMFRTALQSFLTEFATWGLAVSTACGVSFVAMSGEVSNLSTDTKVSPSVKVEGS